MNTVLRTGICWAVAWMVVAFATMQPAVAQGPRNGDGNHTWPDTLEIVTVTGTVEVNTDAMHPRYDLDEGDDGTIDYHLSFGPWWYEPASGATRPEDGQSVTIVGGIMESDEPLVTILVLDIDGLVWRTIEDGLFDRNTELFWNTEADGTPETITGVVLVDTTYFYDHYYLDTTDDGVPEYKLGLGPPWYEPASGAVRPEDGATVTVVGLVHEQDGIDLLTVFELDGLVWRLLDEPAPWAGRWVRKGQTDSTRVYCVNCTEPDANWVAFPPGHMDDGTGEVPWPDSIFVQFWEIHPDSVPGERHTHRFVGFYMEAHDPLRNRLMEGQFGGFEGRMRFEEEHRMRVRYFEADLEARNLAEEDLEVQYWDEDEAQWVVVPEAEVDMEANVITFTSLDLASYYALYAPNLATAIEEPAGGELPSGIELAQNYPNPFNPSTVIAFTLNEPARVVLTVYDVLGRKVATLIEGTLQPGPYEVRWDGRNEAGRAVAGGVYLYRLNAGSHEATRAMVLLK